jgi:hypothetical protein
MTDGNSLHRSFDAWHKKAAEIEHNQNKRGFDVVGESSEPLPSAWRKVLEVGRVPDPIASTAPRDESIGIVRQLAM